MTSLRWSCISMVFLHHRLQCEYGFNKTTILYSVRCISKKFYYSQNRSKNLTAEQCLELNVICACDVHTFRAVHAYLFQSNHHTEVINTKSKTCSLPKVPRGWKRRHPLFKVRKNARTTYVCSARGQHLWMCHCACKPNCSIHDAPNDASAVWPQNYPQTNDPDTRFQLASLTRTFSSGN